MSILKIKDYVAKHADLFTILGLCIFCYVIFFFNIGNYALMDVDETRYVSMARDMFHSKDFMTLYLNGEYFFEKPPLYFWGECLSFAIFGKINEFTARFPVALYSSLSIFLVYFVGKKIISRQFGIISALILATSLEFIILGKFAILDIVVTACVGFSVLFGFMTFFCDKESHKKYWWWLFYIFSGLAVMAKGIPGFILPFGIMFFASIAAKKFKEIFRPQYILVGTLLFLLIVLPWHIAMFKIHDPLFYQEYILKHHLNRFINSENIGREQPFYFYILTFLWGFFPWTLSAIAVGIAKIKSLFKTPLNIIKYEDMTNAQRFLLLNVIALTFTFLFFSVSSTKLITYILPVYFFSAYIMGFVWDNYIKDGRHKKAINLSMYILGGLFVLVSVVAMFMPLFLPTQLYNDILIAKWFCIILLGAFGIASIISAYKNKRIALFASIILFITLLSAIGTEKFYKIDYKFGQDDLIEFATIAKQRGTDELIANGFSRRYSLIYYYGKIVKFEIAFNNESLEKELSKANTLIIIKNKEMHKIDENMKYQIIKTGRKYTLVEGIKK